MFERFLSVLREWDARASERQKLQHAYLALIVLLTVAAGLVSLINSRLGHQLMVVVLAAVIAFGANAVVWNLLNSSLLLKLKAPNRARPQRRR